MPAGFAIRTNAMVLVKGVGAIIRCRMKYVISLTVVIIFRFMIKSICNVNHAAWAILSETTIGGLVCEYEKQRVKDEKIRGI